MEELFNKLEKELNDNKLEILELLVYEFLNYYYTNVEKNN